MQTFCQKLFAFRLPLTLGQLRLLAILGLLAAAAAAAWEAAGARGLWGALQKEAAELTWLLLTATIFLGLTARLLPQWRLATQLLPLRREVGVATALAATAHAGGLLAAGGQFGWLPAWQFFTVSSATFTGFLGLLILLVLAATSCVAAIRLLGARGWRWLHRTAHLAFLLGATHIALLRGWTEPKAVLPLVLYLLGYGYYFYRARRTV